MKLGAVVPARLGSKRVPKKNISPLFGKPLLCWTVDKLLESGTFDNISVSTESEEVKQVVREFYPASEVKILQRPDRLARDNVSATEVFLHYMDAQPEIEFGAIFLPTYPFRSTEKIQWIHSTLQSRYYWRVFSHTNEKFCTGEYYFPTEAGLKNIFSKHIISCPALSSAYVYHHRHCPPRMWHKLLQTPNERALVIHNDILEDIDIDYPEDFLHAEYIAAGAKPLYRKPVSHHYNDWTITTPEGVNVEDFINYIGINKFEDTRFPLLVAHTVKHAFASELNLTEVYSKIMFNCAESIVYVNALDLTAEDALEEGKRTQYRESKYYRIHRTPDLDNIFSNVRNYPTHDHHGINFCTENVHTFSSEMVPLARNGSMLGHDTLSWDRVISEEELMKQDFFVSPVLYQTNHSSR